MLDPLSRPPLAFARVLALLDQRRVRWVLAGSTVLRAYGARIELGDLDIVPALDPHNLEAISACLDDLDAVPAHFVDWERCEPLDWHATWRPRPATVENLDHLYVTAAGMVDIVPRLCGTFDELQDGATEVRAMGTSVLLADPASVLARISGRRRKDVSRASEIAELRRRLDAGSLGQPDLSALR